MATFETSRTAPFGAVAILNVVHAYDAVAEKLHAWSTVRKTTKILNGLTMSQLEDIGLCQNAKSTGYQMAVRGNY